MSRTEDWLSLFRGASKAATDHQLDAAARALHIELPADYCSAMRQADGGEAAFGESWVRLWRADELVEMNASYEVTEFAPGFTYFGTNGGGEAYAWDWRPQRKALYVVIPMIGADPGAAVPCGDSFEEFLSVLHKGIPF